MRSILIQFLLQLTQGDFEDTFITDRVEVMLRDGKVVEFFLLTKKSISNR